MSLFIEDFTQAIKSLHMASGRPSTGLVFVDEFGEPLSPDWFSKRFAALCRDAGVPDINVHSSRHTLAYLMDEWGIPPRRAAKWLGHDQSTYLGIYLFDRADDLQRTAIELGAMRRSARVSA